MKKEDEPRDEHGIKMDPSPRRGEGDCERNSDRGDAQDNSTQKQKIKELIKKKLKPVHQEIIAPPGQ